MLDLPEQLVPFRTMQVDVIPQGCLETHASYRCCKPGIQLTGHPEPPIKEAIRRPRNPAARASKRPAASRYRRQAAEPTEEDRRLATIHTFGDSWPRSGLDDRTRAATALPNAWDDALSRPEQPDTVHGHR